MSGSGGMVPYVIRQGDYFDKLAFTLGFDAGEVWEHPKNEALRGLRKDPNVLAPGDIVFVPAAKKPGLPLRKGQTNKYVAKVPKVEVTLAFVDEDGPLKDEPCEVLGGAKGTEPKTDGEGKLTLRVAVTVREAEVRFPSRHLSFHVNVGDMDPHDEASGVKKRLQNLGFYVEGAWADDEAALAGAIASFQGANGIEATGALDDATRDALKGKHGT